jgi:hypothetical protein
MPVAGPNQGQRPLQPDPRPDEIATRRFSRTLWGPAPGEVRRELLAIAAALDRSRAEHTRELLGRRALEGSLEAASTMIQDLHRALRAAKAELMLMEAAGAAALEVLRSARAAARAIRRSVEAVPSSDGGESCRNP